MGNATNDFITQIESHGFKVRVISIEHIEEIQSDIENTKQTHKDVNNYIGKYLNKFNYKIPENLLEAKSIIVVAVPQPIVRIHFTLNRKKHAVIMPPMYLLNTSSELEEEQKKISEVTTILQEVLTPKNCKVVKTNLPCKLIAVKSGLGAYGKNNICYINSESSFYWIGVYISDMLCENDSWQKSTTMEMCESCDLCLKNCPTGAITNDRFIIHANKCITLQNESKKDFPKWLEPKWHNSIIGCMRCQIVCPANKNHIKDVEDFAEFDDWETRMILEKTPLGELPKITYRKLELINFIEDYDLLARNLNVLINLS